LKILVKWKTLAYPRVLTVVDLQKLKELVKELDGLDGDVTALLKTKEGLESDCITLDARVSFLNEGIAAAKDKQSGAIADAQALLGNLKTQLAGEKKTLADLRQAAKSAEQQLGKIESLHTVRAEELQKQIDGLLADKKKLADSLLILNGELADRRSEITIVLRDKKQKEQELSELTTLVASTKEDLTTSKAKYGALQEEEKGKVSGIRRETEEVIADLEDANTLLEATKLELAKAHAEHEGFKEYEYRADKAMKAREQAILDKEQQLNMDSRTSKRRNSILENLA
jgi:chromosome segregation ATPase